MLNSIYTTGCAKGVFESKRDIVKSNKKLINTIKRLENDIADGSWSKKAYAEMDIEIMPLMVSKANKKYPNLHLSFLSEPEFIVELIEKNISQNKRFFRFITNMGKDNIHCALIDCKIINNKISLILFEPSSKACSGANLLAIRLTLALKRHPIPECFFVMCEMDLQRSISECGIFSLTLAKKIHFESDKIKKIHQDNIAGKFSGVSGFITYNEVDKYLPPSLLKHVQSITRLNKFMDIHPEYKVRAINKKGENVIERFVKNLVAVNNKKISVSLHKKRISEYSALLKS